MQAGNQGRHDLGCVTEIRVEQHDGVGRRSAATRKDGRFEALVTLVITQSYRSRMLALERVQDGSRIIGGAVIDDDEFDLVFRFERR